MATLESIQASFDQFARDQLVRDEGIRRAFEIFASTVERTNATLAIISQQITDQNGGFIEAVRAATLDSLRAIMMIRAYRMRGHCTNCGNDRLLGLFSVGHEVGQGVLGRAKCPACGNHTCRWDRLAGPDETPGDQS